MVLQKETSNADEDLELFKDCELILSVNRPTAYAMGMQISEVPSIAPYAWLVYSETKRGLVRKKHGPSDMPISPDHIGLCAKACVLGRNLEYDSSFDSSTERKKVRVSCSCCWPAHVPLSGSAKTVASL
ncbi:UNVERIFIED_CONTAM: hypothetical protein Sindi_2593400 [Sesamum indicum]